MVAVCEKLQNGSATQETGSADAQVAVRVVLVLPAAERHTALLLSVRRLLLGVASEPAVNVALSAALL